MPLDSRLARSFAFVETVKGATNGRVAPGKRCAVVRVCREFGKFATEALDLGRDVASVQIGCGERVDASREPFGPLVFDQGGGISEMGALDVRQLEFASVAEDPFGGELRHGLDFVLGEDGMFGDVFEPAVVGAVAWAKGHPLRVDDDRARPELVAVFAVDLRVFVFHEFVDFGDEGREVEGGREDTDAEVVVAREVGVVRHGCEEGEQPLECFWFVPEQGPKATGPDVVLVAVHLDSEVRDDAEIARRTTKEGMEHLWVAAARDLLEVAVVVDKLDGHDMVAKEAE